MAARKNRGTKDHPWADIVRQRIQAGNIENRLMKALNGEIELTSVQATIGLGLLRKVIPDLSATELSGEIDNKHRVVSGAPLSDKEWEERYAENLEPPAKPNGKVNGKTK